MIPFLNKITSVVNEMPKSRVNNPNHSITHLSNDYIMVLVPKCNAWFRNIIFQIINITPNR